MIETLRSAFPCPRDPPPRKTAMKHYSLTLLPDALLLRGLRSIVSRDCETTAEMLAHVAEVASRRLWADEGHPSMLDYCVRGLHMTQWGVFDDQEAVSASLFDAALLIYKIDPSKLKQLVRKAKARTQAALVSAVDQAREQQVDRDDPAKRESIGARLLPCPHRRRAAEA